MVVVGICLVAVGFYLRHAIACSIDDPEVEELAARSFVENIPEVQDSSTLLHLGSLAGGRGVLG